MGGLLLACLVVPAAGFEHEGAVGLFGQGYRVDRFNYHEDVRVRNELALRYDGTVRYDGLTEAQGVHALGNGRFLFATSDMGRIRYDADGDGIYDGAYANYVIEAEMTGNVGGDAELRWVRNVVVSDPTPNLPPLLPFPAALHHTKALSPSGPFGEEFFGFEPEGITINPTSQGIGAGGGIILANTDEEEIDAYRFDLSDPTDCNPDDTLDPTQSDSGFTGWFETEPYGPDSEAVTFVADPDDDDSGWFYVVDQSRKNEEGGYPSQYRDNYALEVFDLFGNHQRSLPIAGDLNPAVTGDPKGATFLADSDHWPAAVRADDGSGAVLVSLDEGIDSGLQVVDINGNELYYQPMVGRDGKMRVGWDIDRSEQAALELAGVTVDANTGQLFLIDKGLVFVEQHFWMLTPTVAGDATGPSSRPTGRRRPWSGATATSATTGAST